jgi:hypothetical protein
LRLIGLDDDAILCGAVDRVATRLGAHGIGALSVADLREGERRARRHTSLPSMRRRRDESDAGVAGDGVNCAELGHAALVIIVSMAF